MQVWHAQCCYVDSIVGVSWDVISSPPQPHELPEFNPPTEQDASSLAPLPPSLGAGLRHWQAVVADACSSSNAVIDPSFPPCPHQQPSDGGGGGWRLAVVGNGSAVDRGERDSAAEGAWSRLPLSRRSAVEPALPPPTSEEVVQWFNERADSAAAVGRVEGGMATVLEGGVATVQSPAAAAAGGTSGGNSGGKSGEEKKDLEETDKSMVEEAMDVVGDVRQKDDLVVSICDCSLPGQAFSTSPDGTIPTGSSVGGPSPTLLLN